MPQNPSSKCDNYCLEHSCKLAYDDPGICPLWYDKYLEYTAQVKITRTSSSNGASQDNGKLKPGMYSGCNWWV